MFTLKEYLLALKLIGDVFLYIWKCVFVKLNHTQKTKNNISSSSSEQVYNTVDKLSHQPTVCANRHKITRNKKICIFFAKEGKKISLSLNVA